MMSWRVAPAQDDGKAVLERVCAKCHELETAVSQRNTRERWSAVVDDMVARGAEASDSDIEKIINYLAKNHGPRVKVNQATAQELARALEVPAGVAAAIVDYREKHGAFKTLEDLKKVPTLDGKVIDEKKDRVDFSDAK
jgi:competence protein ComEA